MTRHFLGAALAAMLVSHAPHAIADAGTTRAALKAAARESAAKDKAPPLSRDLLLQRAPVANVQISPDGRYLAYLRRDAQKTGVMLKEIAHGEAQRVLADAGQTEMYWSGDSRYLWLVDDAGLAVFDVAKREARRIHQWDENRHQRFWLVDVNAPAHAVIREKVAKGNAWRYRYLRINIAGETHLLHESALPLRDALLTVNGELAFSATYDGAPFDTVIRRHDAGGAHEILRCAGAEQCRFAGYSRERGALWLLSHHGEDTLSLQRWQAASGWQTVHRDPAGMADASGLLWSKQDEDWIAIAYHPDRKRWYGNGAKTSAQLAALATRIPGANLYLSASMDGNRWLVHARHATWQFDRYYLYQPADDVLLPLFEHAQRAAMAAPDALARAEPVRYRSRDGMLLHGYVYLPPGIEAANAPLIAVLHGGPFSRERDSYDAITQLLANRGYVVFTPNFRASTGYGKRYLLAPQGEFGNGKVLEDILDGIDFLLALGIGDAKRQAVMGHSFGGYASLLAASHDPARFSFALASAAPVDFTWGMQWIADNGGSALPEDGPPAEIFFAHHGIPLNDANWRKRMQEESPLANIGRLRAPVYLWAGAQDDRVPLKGIVRYVAQAREMHASADLLIDPDSGHNPGSRLNLEAIVFLIEAAANRHFGGGLTPPSPALERFLRKNLRVDDAALLE